MYVVNFLQEKNELKINRSFHINEEDIKGLISRNPIICEQMEELVFHSQSS